MICLKKKSCSELKVLVEKYKKRDEQNTKELAEANLALGMLKSDHAQAINRIAELEREKEKKEK